ncbi:hypothetical protein [Nonomuraea dietziae]|uniref:hypothetical protein n=1 Tax=Nonomuraea dietziae TaxID=65515 RepID=UPI0031D89D32
MVERRSLYQPLRRQGRAVHGAVGGHTARPGAGVGLERRHKARQDGGGRPVELLITGSRAYLTGAVGAARTWSGCSWTATGHRGSSCCAVRGEQWLRQNAALRGGGGREPIDRLTVAVLTTVDRRQAAREVATSDTEEAACEVIEAAVVLIRRLDPVSRHPDQPFDPWDR